jgi:hypothetical protein
LNDRISSLAPTDTVQKSVISTTSRFVGEYKTADVLVTHAFPHWANDDGIRRWNEGPLSRSAYIYAFRTPAFPREVGVALPDYSARGDVLCDYCSVLFGKRFEHHGLIEGSGMFWLPAFANFDSICVHTLPHNSHKTRADFPIELNLAELERIEKLVQLTDVDARFLRYFRTSASYYAQALRAWEKAPETAYLNLVMAGEVLSNSVVFAKGALIDERMAAILDAVREYVPRGDKVATLLSKQFQSIRKRFVLAILGLLPKDFFLRSEVLHGHGMFKEATFERAIAAAYDLRSVHLHTGAPFGVWVSRFCVGGNEEVQIGRPVVAEKALGKALADAPTLVGLERVIRSCLLEFAAQNGAFRFAP